MSTETLIGKTTTAMTFHAGQWAKAVPVGTLVEVRQEAWEGSGAAIYARVVGHPRIAEVVYRSAIEPV